MKKTSRFSVVATACAVLSLFSFSACTADYMDNDTPIMYNISGDAAGAQVVPAVTGTGTATIAGTYNSRSNMLMYTTTWNGLTGGPTNGGIFLGPTGQNGRLVGTQWMLGTSTAATGTYSGQVTLSPAQERELLSGNAYYTLGTTTNESGEVRGQITATP